MRGIYGAVTLEGDDHDSAYVAIRVLLEEIAGRNDVIAADIVSILFTLTPDLRCGAPALTAWDMGWGNVPTLYCVESDARNSLRRCIRVIVHVNTTRSMDEIEHVYLGETPAFHQQLADQTTEPP